MRSIVLLMCLLFVGCTPIPKNATPAQIAAIKAANDARALAIIQGIQQGNQTYMQLYQQRKPTHCSGWTWRNTVTWNCY